MAIYVPDSTRRRRLVGIAAACLLVGLVVGAALGHVTAPRVDDAVARAHDHAQDAVTALQRLPIEYEQALAGEGEDTSTITSALGRARADFDAAYEEIDLFGPAGREPTDRGFETLAQDISEEVSLEEFQLGISETIAEIQATFGLRTDLRPD